MAAHTSILVISDLHVGLPGDAANDWRASDASLLRFIGAHNALGRLVVLAGDVFECWEAAPDPRSRLQEICAARPALASALSNPTPGLVLLSGNHDAVLLDPGSGFPGAMPDWTGSLPGAPSLRIHIAHGHQADAWNAGLRGAPDASLGRCIACCLGHGERLLYPTLDDDLSALDAICRGEKDSLVLAAHAEALGAANGYDVVVYGHTHDQRLSPFSPPGKGVYANSGAARHSSRQIDAVLLHPASLPAGGLVVSTVAASLEDESFLVRESLILPPR
jgi:UDP-2,3-diacylglucosamine pyrophosphatase LpxH